MSKEERKVKVLKAASDCFAKFGYDKTTLDDIGKMIGLNKASLYYYYKNKEDIYCDVIYQDADLYMQELQKKLKGTRSAEAKVLTYLGERLTYFRQVMNLHNLTMDTVRKIDPVFTDIYNKILAKESAFLASLIKEGIDSGEFIKTDSNKIADALLHVASSIRYRELHISYVKMAIEADFTRIIEEIRYVSKLIMRGLKVA